jgi:beta-lactamase superfamily II metal-dependent hydrolase
VDEIWYAGNYRGRAAAALRGVRRAEAVAAGKAMQLGRLSLTVLHPEPGRRAARGGESEVNNGSVVVKAAYGESRYLFPGDCELGCWEEMFKLHRSELRADVLKAAHHGSSNGTTSGVLINVRPRTVVISCGAGNRYGHPHSIVTRLVEKLRATLWRTDVHGAIHCAGAVCNPEPR